LVALSHRSITIESVRVTYFHPKGESMARRNRPADELPDEARALIQRTEKAVAEVRKKAEREVKAIQKTAREQTEEAKARADEAVRQHHERLLEGLHSVKDSHARENRFDEALMVYQQIRRLQAEVSGVQPDPGSASHLAGVTGGKTYHLEVTGAA